jgi:NADH-quinone oxidoreductase subunit H
MVKLLARQQTSSEHGAEAVLAPIYSTVAALLLFAAIPFGEIITLEGQAYRVQVADPGLLYVLAVLSLSFFGPLWGAWIGGDQRALLGGVAYVSRQLGYLLSLGFALAGVVLVSGSVYMEEIIWAQTQSWGPLPLWNAWLQPLGCAVFLCAGLAWAGRPPFEADAGFSGIAPAHNSGYGGGSLALLQLADHARLLAIACLAVALYGGGWHLPGFAESGHGGFGAELAKVGVFAAKTFLALLLLLWVRWSTPGLGLWQGRFWAWKILLPLSLLNLVATAWVATLI